LQRIRWLPVRRIQMLPQRSQYLRSIGCDCDESKFTVIFHPVNMQKSPDGSAIARLVGVEDSQARRCKGAGDRARFCFEGLLNQ
jgi:hypothetical protein